MQTDSVSNRKIGIEMMLKSDDHAKAGFDIILRGSNPGNLFDDLQEAGLFNPDKNRGPQNAPKEGFVTIPFWPSLPYLLAIAKTADLPLANKVIEVIRTVSETGTDNFHTWTVFAEILVALPTEAVLVSDIDFLKTWLESKYDRGGVAQVIADQLLPKFLSDEALDNKQKAERILFHATEISGVARGGRRFGRVEGIIDDFWLKEIFGKNISALAYSLKEQCLNVLLLRVEEVHVRDKFASQGRSAIESSEQDKYKTDYFNVIVSAFRDALQTLVEVEPSASKKLISKLLRSRILIIRRLAIYTINVNFEALGRVIHKAFPRLLKNVGHLHELYELIATRANLFTEDEKSGLLNYIQAMTEGIEPGEKLERLQHFQERWLRAVREGATASRQSPTLEDHPSFISYTESFIGSEVSPYTIDQILASVHSGDFVSQVNSFESVDSWRGPTVRRLADTITEAFQAQPTEFLKHVSTFSDLKPVYRYAIVDGFKKLWDLREQNQSGFDWNQAWTAILRFIEIIIKPTNILLDDDSSFLLGGSDWIPPLVSDLISSAVKNDNAAIDREFHPAIERILRLIVEQAEAKDDLPDDRAYNHAINTSKGRAIEALFAFTLRAARLGDKEHQSHEEAWDSVSDIFESELAKCRNANFDFSSQLGAYFGQLNYLCSEWVIQNIHKIFPAQHFPKNFSCALQGLSYSHATKTIYIILKNAKIIESGLALPSLSRGTEENLVQRVALAYLSGDEQLDDEVVKHVVGNSRWLSIWIAYYAGLQHNDLTQTHRDRILTFWTYAIDLFEGVQTEIDKQPKFVLLSRYLKNVSEVEEELLRKSTVIGVEQFDMFMYLEQLKRLARTSPDAVARLVKQLLSKVRLSYDYNNNLAGIIEILLKHSTLKRQIIAICREVSHMQEFRKYYVEAVGLSESGFDAH